MDVSSNKTQKVDKKKAYESLPQGVSFCNLTVNFIGRDCRHKSVKSGVDGRDEQMKDIWRPF